MAEAQMSPEQRKHFEDAMIGFLLAHPEHIGEVQQTLPDQSYFTNHDNAVTYYFLCEMDANGIIPKGRRLPAELYRLSHTEAARKRHLVYSYADDTALSRALAGCLTLWNKEYGAEESHRELAKFIRWYCHDAILIRQLAQDIVDRVGSVPESQSEEFATGLSQRFDKIALQVQDAGELQHISEATSDIEALLDLMGDWQPTSNSTETGLRALDNVLGGLNGGEVIVLAANTGVGKSLPDSSVIPTPDGPRRVGDIQAGDAVFARDGRPTRVLGTFPQAEPLEAYEVRLADGRAVRCSADHIWTVWRDGETIPSDMTVREMLADKGAYELPLCGAIELPEADLPVDPYEFGATIARLDGEGTGSPRRIPQEYLRASKAQRLDLLRGMMDQAGRCALAIDMSKEAGRRCSAQVWLSLPAGPLAGDARALVWGLGMSATDAGHGGWSHIDIGCDPAAIPSLFERNDRELQKAELIVEDLADEDDGLAPARLPIVAIRDLGYKEPMTCFLVEDDEHLFLADDCVVTHNTSLSMTIAENVALGIGTGEPRSVIIFSLEMMNTQLHFRMASRLGRINTEKFNLDYKSIMNRQGRIDRGENMPQADIDQLEADKESFRRRYERLRETVRYSKGLPIYQDTAGNMNVSVMKTMISQKQKEMADRGEPPLGLVIIDYLQILQPTAEDANENRSVVVGNMSRRIKQMAKDAGVPVLLLAQLNRQSNVDERPKLSQLRESGSIEQDADKVIFLYCEHASKEMRDYASEYDTEPQQDLALKRDQMKVKIAVEKNRQGRQGEVNAIFDKQFQNFVTQTPNYKKGETFDQFFDKYYRMTRSGSDLFWPLKADEVPPELEKYRSRGIVENAYLGEDGRIVLPNDAGAGRGGQQGMSVTTRRSQAPAPGTQATLDVPAPPVVNDLQSGFEEVPDDGEYVAPWDAPATTRPTPPASAPTASPTASSPASNATSPGVSPQPVVDDTPDPDERYDRGWHAPPFLGEDEMDEPEHADLDVDASFYDGYDDDDDEMFDLSTVDELDIADDGFGYGDDDEDDDDEDGDGGYGDGYEDSMSLLDEISKKL